MTTVPSPPAGDPMAEVRAFAGGLRWRILLSILGPIAWLVFTLLYVGFWASGYTLFQDLIVVLVSILLLFGTLASAWILWGGRRMRRWAWRQMP